jgi:hypothetical protein
MKFKVGDLITDNWSRTTLFLVMDMQDSFAQIFCLKVGKPTLLYCVGEDYLVHPGAFEWVVEGQNEV